MKIELFIYNNGNIYNLADFMEDNIKLFTQRMGAPSKLTFTLARPLITQGTIFFEEGDRVELIVNGNNLFRGYVFTKSRNKEQFISVTCYDQIRYLKNKDSYIYTNKKASDLVKMIAEDFNLEKGYIADTGLYISRIENNQTLMDIIYNALDATTTGTAKQFVLYDDFGKLTLKNLNDMKLPLMLVSDDSNMIDFNYKSDIDSDTYNKIKICRDNGVSGISEFIRQDKNSQTKFGVLQYYTSMPRAYTDGEIINIGNKLLSLKNRVKRTLSVDCLAVEGEEIIRAGCSIMVRMGDLGENKIEDWLTIERCTHTFSNNEHRLNLEFVELKDSDLELI